MTNLQTAIDRVYSAFREYQKPATIVGCPCCINNKDIETMLKHNLHLLTPKQLASYASSVFLTVGDRDDFLYFLPRILEVTATDPSWWPSVEVVGRAIATSKPESWTQVQRLAVSEVFLAKIQAGIEVGAYFDIDDWLCGVARAGFEVEPLLTVIESSKDAILFLFEENAGTLADRKLSNAFWELPNNGHDKIVDWFYSDPIREIPLNTYGCSLLYGLGDLPPERIRN